MDNNKGKQQKEVSTLVSAPNFLFIGAARWASGLTTFYVPTLIRELSACPITTKE